MSLRLRTLLAGFIEPCMSTASKRPPSGEGWLHEIKHDGYRCIARKDGKRVRLYSLPGQRSNQAVYPDRGGGRAAQKALTCIIGGEAVACGPDNIASRQYRSFGEAEPPKAEHYGCTAIAEISIFTSRGRRATSTVARAGGAILKNVGIDLVHLSELVKSLRKTVVVTT